MKKCEVLNNCNLSILKGSIVFVDDRQFEVAKKLLKPIKENKEAKVEKVEDEVAKPQVIEKRKSKK